MTQQEIAHWNAIADDVENRNRVDAGLIEMQRRECRVSQSIAVMEVEALEANPETSIFARRELRKQS